MGRAINGDKYQLFIYEEEKRLQSGTVI